MEICSNSICINPAKVVKVIEAAFSMTSSASSSQKTVMICKSCADQEERMRSLE